MEAARAGRRRRPGLIPAKGGLADAVVAEGEGDAVPRLRAGKHAPATSAPSAKRTTTSTATRAPPPPPRTAPASDVPRTASSSSPLLTALDGYAAFFLWTALIFAGLLGPPFAWAAAACLRSVRSLAAAAAVTAAAAALAALPLPEEGTPPPPWADALCRYLVTRTIRFLRRHPDGSAGLRVVCAPGAAEALEAVSASGRPLLLGVEPHSALPLGAVLALSPHAQPELPPAARPPPCLVGARFAASSAAFAVPLVRHLWWWLGARPADRASVRALLGCGEGGGDGGGGGGRRATTTPRPALALCPGGVAEVALLTRPPPPPAPKTETLYLKSRTGFVREALRSRAALVPVFCLGQTAMFHWTRPPLLPLSLLERFSRAVGCMPLGVHNGWGLPAARRGARVTVLVGAPVPAVEAAAAAGEGGCGDNPAAVRAGADGFIEGVVGLVARLQGRVEGEEGTRVVVV
jgi:hypothetical protein